MSDKAWNLLATYAVTLAAATLSTFVGIFILFDSNSADVGRAWLGVATPATLLFVGAMPFIPRAPLSRALFFAGLMSVALGGSMPLWEQSASHFEWVITALALTAATGLVMSISHSTFIAAVGGRWPRPMYLGILIFLGAWQVSYAARQLDEYVPPIAFAVLQVILLIILTGLAWQPQGTLRSVPMSRGFRRAGRAVLTSIVALGLIAMAVASP